MLFNYESSTKNFIKLYNKAKARHKIITVIKKIIVVNNSLRTINYIAGDDAVKGNTRSHPEHDG